MAKRVILYKGISIGIHDEIFNIFITDYDFALCALLGDRNDVFNMHVLLFLEDACALHQSFSTHIIIPRNKRANCIYSYVYNVLSNLAVKKCYKL